MTRANLSGEWFDWEWDDSLFLGSAHYYDKGRLPYAPNFAKRFAHAVQFDRSGSLLDVGCGPGSITLLLAPHLATVTGVDSDVGMIEHAERLSSERAIDNATWLCCRAEDITTDIGTFDVVTFAASFHWMDRPMVANTVRSMLNPGGAVVQVDKWHRPHLREDESRSELPTVPHDKIDSLRREYLGDDRWAGASIRNSSPDDEAEVFRAAGLVGPEIVRIRDGRDVRRSIDDVVAEVFSTSSTAPHLFGDRFASFEAELRAMLAKRSDGGLFGAHLPDNRLQIYRTAS